MKVYKCNICGNVVELEYEGGGELFCCGQPMQLLEEKTADTSTEKHVPYIEHVDGKYVVRVGQNVAHPMEEKHYIVWIDLIVDGVLHRKYLKPGDEPKAEFEIPKGESVKAREYCNLHSLWSSEL